MYCKWGKPPASHYHGCKLHVDSTVIHLINIECQITRFPYMKGLSLHTAFEKTRPMDNISECFRVVGYTYMPPTEIYRIVWFEMDQVLCLLMMIHMSSLQICTWWNFYKYEDLGTGLIINTPSHYVIQYFVRNWPWYSLRGLHIRITWFLSKTKWYGTTFGNCSDNVFRVSKRAAPVLMI